MLRVFKLSAAFLLFAGNANAEHRAALVMDVHAYEAAELKLPALNLQPVLQRLEAHGFRCTVISNPDNKLIKREVEGFATRTPVRGTALVYFIGRAAPGEYLKQKTLCLLDVKSKPGRGLGVNFVLDQLQAKGGSSRNLVILDTLDKVPPPHKIPNVHHDESILNTLDKPSKAVSPPNKMIPGRKAGDEVVPQGERVRGEDVPQRRHRGGCRVAARARH